MAAKALWQMRIKRRPFVLSHGINARCNLSCSFCEYWRRPGKEMSMQEIFRMLEEASSFGIGVYNAWTVEPLLREDLPEILSYAKSQGLITSLITNGRLLARRAKELPYLDYLANPAAPWVSDGDRLKLETFEGQSPGNSTVLSVDLSKDRQESNL